MTPISFTCEPRQLSLASVREPFIRGNVTTCAVKVALKCQFMTKMELHIWSSSCNSCYIRTRTPTNFLHAHSMTVIILEHEKLHPFTVMYD